MQEKIIPKKSSRFIEIYAIIIGLLLVLDIAFMILTTNEAKTITLLRKELMNLEQNNQIISSSQEILSKYTNEIDVISQVFPSETNIPDVIKQFEKEIQSQADSYRLKFNSVTPVPEQDRLYLPLTITLNTDMSRLINLLNYFEQLPYMTHITQISSKNTEGYLGKAEINIALKLYVQNPFSSK